MNSFFESLSFKQKIVAGFSILSSILILGMAYMLFQYTNVASLSTDIIERQQPVTNAASNALKYTQSARSQLQKYQLTEGKVDISDYSQTIEHLQQELQILESYAKTSDMVIDQQQLDRSNVIIEEINQLSLEVIELNQDYAKNHPIITTASILLNPPALEYLGLVNQIIDDSVEEGMQVEDVFLLTEMRHSWAQMMSHVRIALATKSLDALVNVTAYVNVNIVHTERVKARGLDLGFAGVEKLERLRREFLTNLDHIIVLFKTSIWRKDTHIMATEIMPLYDELESYLSEITRIQLTNSEAAGVGLTSELSFVRYVFIVLIVIGLAFSFVFSLFITSSLRKPLQKLVTATQDVAKGNLDIKIRSSGHDEIAHLNKSFNNMVADIRQSHSELTDAIKAANQASEAKSRFVSSISHELRTPLNAILGFAQLYEYAENLSEEQKTNARKIYHAGEHLLSLINGVLNLTKVESGHLELSMEIVSLADIFDDFMCIAEPLAKSYGITLEGSPGRYADICVHVDRTRLEQVILNLVSNAVKYNRSDGSVCISCSEGESGAIRISISDTGPGIAADKLSDAFQAFNRLGAETGDIEGTGLGLMIAKQLVELMDGKLDVDSIEGQGSHFWIELNRCTEVTTDSDVEIPQSEPISSNAEPPSGSNERILIAEDNEFNQDVLEQQLNIFGYTADFANDGAEALEKLQIGNYDILLTDIHMPEMGGFELVDKIRQQEKETDSHMPIIAITANAMDGEEERCLESGMDAFLSKPVNLDDLRQVLEQWLPQRMDSPL